MSGSENPTACGDTSMNSRLVPIWISLAIVGFVWPWAQVFAADSSPEIWQTDVVAACLRSQSEAKPLVVYIYSSTKEKPSLTDRACERDILSNPAFAGLQEWAAMTKIDLAAPALDGVAGDVLRAIDVTETPVVDVVAYHREGWRSYGQSSGKQKPTDFMRVLSVDIAQAMIAIRRDEYRAMSEIDLARQRASVDERCTQLQRESERVEPAYDQQLRALRDDGQFSAGAFAVTARERQNLLQRWIRSVVDLGALPEFELDPLCESTLAAYLFDHEANRQLASNLISRTVEDRLPDSQAIQAAQNFVRAAEQKREESINAVQEPITGAGQIQHSQSLDGEQSGRERPEPGAGADSATAKSNPCSSRCPTCSRGDFHVGPIKKRPFCVRWRRHLRFPF